MKRGKYESAVPAKNRSLKVVPLLLALVLLVGGTIGVTLAYLTARSNHVENTFVAGNVGSLELQTTTANSFVIVPGKDLEKDTKVVFSGNNIPAYVFLEVTGTVWQPETANGVTNYYIGANKEMSWTLADGWIPLAGADNVYYRVASAKAAGAAADEWYVIKPQLVVNQAQETVNVCKITVSAGITEADIANYVSKLNFKAYAIQQEMFETDPAGAWAAVKNP